MLLWLANMGNAGGGAMVDAAGGGGWMEEIVSLLQRERPLTQHRELEEIATIVSVGLIDDLE
jgi:hypothetical protein